MRKVILFLCVFFYFLNGKAQFSTPNSSFTDSYKKQWEKIEKLLVQHKTFEAANAIDSIYNSAKSRNESLIMFKSQLYFLQVVHDTSDNFKEDILAISEQHIKENKFPYNSIWQSITAQLYWEYYLANKYKILERHAIGRDNNTDDIDKWDANRFLDKTASLYLKSISRTDGLKDISIRDFAPVLFGNDSSQTLRPTLFDLLIFRALDFFENDENSVIIPGSSFKMNDPNEFAPAGAFVTQKFATEDLTSYAWLSLQWYKQILLKHESDSLKDAYIDADLKRLAYVYKTSILPDRDQLYLQALQFIETSFPDNPIAAMATYQSAELMGELEGIDTSFIYDEQKNNTYFTIQRSKEKIDYTPVVNKLKSVISKFPNSQAAKKSLSLLNTIENKNIYFENEKVILPGEPSKFLLTYRNTNKVWVRIIPISNVEYRKRGGSDLTSWNKNLLKKNPVYNFQVYLPKSEDYYQHSTEIKVSPLPAGAYALFVSLKGNLSSDSNIVQGKIFQVSALSYVSVKGNDADINEFILNRKTGEPIAHAIIKRYKNNETKSTHEKCKTHKDGSFAFKQSKEDSFSGHINIVYEKDTLWEEYNTVYSANTEGAGPIKTFFFTDNQIYYPGQTIWFKGILVKKIANNLNVIKNKNTEIVFKDTKGNIIKTNKFVTNDLGSFSGSFIVPADAVPGNMKILNESGEIVISVGFYELPDIDIIFDRAKNYTSINTNIKIKGVVKNKNGKFIDGTDVKYKVIRSLVTTYRNYNKYDEHLESPDSELVSGIIQTDKEGRFNINFKTSSDRNISRKDAPIFSYTIYAQVTNSEGKTIATDETINAGYSSIQLINYLPELSKPSYLDTLIIKSETLDGQFIASNIHLQISRLHSPECLYKKRLWKEPDVYIIDSAEYKKLFPSDEYKNESNPNSWQAEEKVYDTTLLLNEKGVVNIPETTWKKNGWYSVEISTKDKKGEDVCSKKLIEVWDKNNEGNIADPLQIEETNTFVEPNELASFTILSGFDSCTILQKEENSDLLASFQKNNYSGKPLTWNMPITESDCGGIALSFMCMKNNRLYSKNITVHIPRINKDLNIKWEPHKDKLSSGTNETWKFTIAGKHEKQGAEMLAFMYDASHEQFTANSQIQNEFFSAIYASDNWESNISSEKSNNVLVNYSKPIIENDKIDYQKFIIIGNDFKTMNYETNLKDKDKFKIGADETALNKSGINSQKINRKHRHRKNDTTLNKIYIDNENTLLSGDIKEIKEKKDTVSEFNLFQKLNTLNEIFPNTDYTNNWFDKKFTGNENINNNPKTVFFYPQLRYDTSGSIQFDFTMPKSTNDWNFVSISHTGDMASCRLEGKIKAIEELKISPFVPDFLIQGDSIIISAKISNYEDSTITGIASLHLFNSINLKPLDSFFNLQNADIGFSIKNGVHNPLLWKIRIPASTTEPVKFMFSAQSGNFTDEEESITLPIRSSLNKTIASVPFYIIGNDSLNKSVNQLFQTQITKPYNHYSGQVTLEYTADPAWYAIQAIAGKVIPSPANTLQTFNSYFEDVLADYFVNSSPAVEELLKKWKSDYSDSVLLSFTNGYEHGLLRSPDETGSLPSQNDIFEKYNIALQFDEDKLAQSQKTTIRKLEELQFQDGGFPWYKGMDEDRYITQNIITGIGKLQFLSGRSTKALDSITKKALYYLDKLIKKEYDLLVKNKADLSTIQISNEDVQYLYMRSFFKDYPGSKSNINAFNFTQQQALQYHSKFSPYLQGMIAMLTYRAGDSLTSSNILKSLKATALTNQQNQMYFAQTGEEYWWYNEPMAQQSLLEECFNTVLHDTACVKGLKLWLISHINNQNPIANSGITDACYTLLSKDLKLQTKQPVININNGHQLHPESKNLKNPDSLTFSKISFNVCDTIPGIRNFRLSIQDNSENSIWGTISRQYLEAREENIVLKKPFTISKLLFIPVNNENGIEFQPVSEKSTLKIGDRVLVRIEINVDKEMDYIEVKDLLPACLEPKALFSGYKSEGGVGYYETIKENCVNFYINHLNRGIYTFEYTVFTTHVGEFSGGTATIQCMNVPKVISKSDGTRIHINANGIK